MLPLQRCLALSALHHIQPEHLCMASCSWFALTHCPAFFPTRLGAPRGQGLCLTGSQALYTAMHRKCLLAEMVCNSLLLFPMGREGMLPELRGKGRGARRHGWPGPKITPGSCNVHGRRRQSLRGAREARTEPSEYRIQLGTPGIDELGGRDPELGSDSGCLWAVEGNVRCIPFSACHTQSARVCVGGSGH